MKLPPQAVVFCGGRGERLRPLTDSLPKPMAPVVGRPFLKYLIEQVRDVGIRQFLLLTGYLGDQIASYFGDGGSLGVNIAYYQGPAEWETGQRLAAAAPLLKPGFLLLYADNIAPISIPWLAECHCKSEKPLTITICPKNGGNIRLAADGRVDCYDQTRAQPGLSRVDIGYMMAERDPILACNPARGPFSLVLGDLASQGQLAVFDPGCFYHSISDLNRLRLTEQYLHHKKILLLDRDGVVNRRPPTGDYVWSRESMVWLDENISALEELSWHGFQFILISNQAGIARGLYTSDEVTSLHAWMAELLLERGIVIRDIFFCPHHWDEGCLCRKPLPGMFFAAAQRHCLRLDHTLYVGDDERDVLASWRAGCPCIMIQSEDRSSSHLKPYLSCRHLSEAVPAILAAFHAWHSRGRRFAMIISRTPFRISFAGGGTDLRSYYSQEAGQVLSTAIDKYLYVVVRRQIGLVEFKYRVNYSKVEFRRTIDEIEHPIVREALRLFEIDYPLEITTFADIPANTGLGSSSAFAVGLVHALTALQGRYMTKSTLASTAARIEIDVLGRAMGKQDHFASAYGNINVFTFLPDESVGVEPVFYRREVNEALQNHLMLFYTGLKRDASEMLRVQERNTLSKMEVLRRMKDQVVPLREILSTGRNLFEFGRLLHEGWQLKKAVATEISNPEIDAWYANARMVGASGGKLLGAGGGGFLLFFVEPQNQSAVAHALSPLYQLPFRFDFAGSRITYYDQSLVV